MIQEIIEEFLWVFIKNVARKIGVAIRWIWFGKQFSFDEILKSKWNVRVGLAVICIIIAAIIAFVV